jgi:hypothetical protein
MNTSFGKFGRRIDETGFRRLGSCTLPAMMFLSISLASGWMTSARSGPGSLLFSAHCVYVENQTTDAQLQTSVYTDLMRWGRLQIAESAQKADIILRISNGNMVRFVSSEEAASTAGAKPSTPAVQSSEESVPPGFTRITVVDAKSGAAIWSGLKKTTGPPASWHLLDGFRDAVEKAHGNK